MSPVGLGTTPKSGDKRFHCEPRVIEARVLRRDEFAAFGTVIENPIPAAVPGPQLQELPANAVLANQGSALKYLDVTKMEDLYSSAPSGQQSRVVMNMFVCAPRSLARAQDYRFSGLYSLEILERHPYTTQTFIPLGVSTSEQEDYRYFVIVAPSLPGSSSNDASFNSPSTLNGDCLPDIKGIKAFIAKGSQAVTYGVGTWHAPMVVIGERPIDFVVVQYANGVADEDCQEVAVKDGKALVQVPRSHGYQQSRSL